MRFFFGASPGGSRRLMGRSRIVFRGQPQRRLQSQVRPNYPNLVRGSIRGSHGMMRPTGMGFGYTPPRQNRIVFRQPQQSSYQNQTMFRPQMRARGVQNEIRRYS